MGKFAVLRYGYSILLPDERHRFVFFTEGAEYRPIFSYCVQLPQLWVRGVAQQAASLLPLNLTTGFGNVGADTASSVDFQFQFFLRNWCELGRDLQYAKDTRTCWFIATVRVMLVCWSSR